MRRIALFIFGSLVLLAAAACGGGSKSVPADAVAVVGSKQIPKSAYDALITQTKRNYKATKRPFPKAGSVALANLRAVFVQFLVQADEYQQEADKYGIKVTDKDVSTRLQQVKKQYYGQPPATAKQMEQRYQQALKQQGFTDQEVRAGLKIQLTREKVQEKVVEGIKVSDSDIQDYYNKHKQQYTRPAQGESRDVRHILVKKKAKADGLYAEVKAHPSRFAALARKWSIDTGSKQYGGRLPGGAVKGHLLKPFERVAFSLKVNEISKPVHTSAGWHIIQALGPVKPAQPAKLIPLSQVKESIRQILLDGKKRDEITKWSADFKKRYCGKISYQVGYAPPPGADPCKQTSTTAATSTG